MNLKFTCTKTQLINAMKKELGVLSLAIETDDDVSSLIETWLKVANVNGEMEFLKPRGCKVEGENVTICLVPTGELEFFGGSEGIREPDRKWVLDHFNWLQRKILSPEDAD